MSPKMWIYHVYFLSSHCLFGYLFRLRSRMNIFGFRSLNFFALHINHSSFSYFYLFISIYIFIFDNVTDVPHFSFPSPIPASTQPLLSTSVTFFFFSICVAEASTPPQLLKGNHKTDLMTLANNRIFTIISA